MTLDEHLEHVVDRETFLAFVNALVADREDEVAKEKVTPSSPYGPGANGWENTTIDSYLDACASWAEDSEGLPSNPSWRAFAQFLYSGKFYE